MQYSFKCPACDHVITVNAASDDEAVAKINAEGDKHQKAVHPDMPPMSEEEMTKMVSAGMKKGE